MKIFSEDLVAQAVQELHIADLSRATIGEVLLVAQYLEQKTGIPFIRMDQGSPGLPVNHSGVEAEKATEYVAWIAVAEDGKTYSEADVVISEFATLDLVAGSSVKVVAGNVKESSSDIEISLTATGAETIYYAYLTKTEAARYATEDD